jgi:hypothetical protein
MMKIKQGIILARLARRLARCCLGLYPDGSLGEAPERLPKLWTMDEHRIGLKPILPRLAMPAHM